MVNPRDAKQLEQFLTIQSYPPFDIEWVHCGLKAIKAIDDGDPERWLDLPMAGHQMTAKDITEFLHISKYLTVAESKGITQ
jgi:hypothetical protein